MNQEPFEKKDNDHVHLTENEYDEVVDRFEKGLTFQNDPYLTRDENHISFSTQEDPIIRKSRKSLGDSEKEQYASNETADDVIEEYQFEDTQSPGIDPNLGPAPFGTIIDEARNDIQGRNLK